MGGVPGIPRGFCPTLPCEGAERTAKRNSPMIDRDERFPLSSRFGTLGNMSQVESRVPEVSGHDARRGVVTTP